MRVASSTRRSVPGRIAAVVAIIAVVGVADRPVYAEFNFVDLPTLLYMTPTALPPLTLPLPYPHPDVPVAALPFDGGTDPITGQIRSIQVNSDFGDPDCVATAANQNYAGCTTVHLTTSRGSLAVNGSSAIDRIDSSGVVLEILNQEPANVYVRGKVEDVNAALQTLIYTPPSGYTFTPGSSEQIDVDAQSGDNQQISQTPVLIRVLDYNDQMELEVPGDQMVPTGETQLSIFADTELPINTPDDANPDWFVEDPDLDQLANDSDTQDELDGVLLAMWATCGWLEVRSTSGFELSSSLTALLTSRGVTPEVATAITDAITLISPEFGSALLASGNPAATPLTGFVGFAFENDAIVDVNYLLSDVTFHTVNPDLSGNDVENQTCQVFTLVSDVGNNGLPFSGGIVDGAFGDGVVEVPWPTGDIGWFNVQVGEGTTIDASFNPTTYDVNEGASTMVNIDITANPASPGTFPAFDLTLEVGVADTATPVDDYDLLPVTVAVPANATSVSVLIQTVDDLDLEGTETINLTITAPDPLPPGFQVTTDVPTAAVSILDDEVDNSTTTTAVDNSTTTTAVDNSTTTTAVDNSTTTTAVDNSTTTTAVDNSTTTTAVDGSTTTTAVDNSTTTTAVDGSTTTTAVDNSTTTTAVDNSSSTTAVADSTTSTAAVDDTTTTAQPGGGGPTTSVGPGSGAGVPTTIVPPFTNLPETGASFARWLLVASALVALGMLARRGVGTATGRG